MTTYTKTFLVFFISAALVACGNMSGHDICNVSLKDMKLFFEEYHGTGNGETGTYRELYIIGKTINELATENVGAYYTSVGGGPNPSEIDIKITVENRASSALANVKLLIEWKSILPKIPKSEDYFGQTILWRTEKIIETIAAYETKIVSVWWRDNDTTGWQNISDEVQENLVKSASGEYVEMFVTASVLNPDGVKCPSNAIERRIMHYGEFWIEEVYFGLERIARSALSSWIEHENYFGKMELWEMSDEDKVVVCEFEQVNKSSIYRFLFCPRIIEGGKVVSIEKGYWVYVDTSADQVIDIKKQEE